MASPWQNSNPNQDGCIAGIGAQDSPRGLNPSSTGSCKGLQIYPQSDAIFSFLEAANRLRAHGSQLADKPTAPITAEKVYREGPGLNPSAAPFLPLSQRNPTKNDNFPGFGTSRANLQQGSAPAQGHSLERASHNLRLANQSQIGRLGQESHSSSSPSTVSDSDPTSSMADSPSQPSLKRSAGGSNWVSGPILLH